MALLGDTIETPRELFVRNIEQEDATLKQAMSAAEQLAKKEIKQTV
jgi:hypothetical protein